MQTLATDAQRWGKSSESMEIERKKLIPAGRFGIPDEFGACCAFLWHECWLYNRAKYFD
jgi:3-oxoacyl-[acyl-carrier protein] reductase